jgi:integrase/recombinase XerD
MAEHASQLQYHGMVNLIDAHLAHLKAAGKSTNTIQDRGRLLRYLDRELPYGVDRAAVEEWEAFLGQEGMDGRPRFAQWTRVTYWMHGNGFYAWAVRRGHIDWNPLDYIQRPKKPIGVPHPVTDEQLAYAVGNSARPYRTAILLAAYAGMRAGEVAAATKRQISQNPIRVHGKGDKQRIVPNHALILAELAHLKDGPVLARPNGMHYTGDAASQMMSEHLTSLGLPEVTLHWFRHWFATTMLRGGPEDAREEDLRPVDLRTVQELMGHASVADTMVYTQISDRQREIGIRTLPVLNANPLLRESA